LLEHAEQLSKKGYEYTMEASYVEIYNEQVRDLLKPGADHDEKHKIVSATGGGCPTVSGVEREPVRSVDAAAGLVRRAAAARAVEATQMNAQSSRSHTSSCCTSPEGTRRQGSCSTAALTWWTSRAASARRGRARRASA
jgi:kinesin family protein C1